MKIFSGFGMKGRKKSVDRVYQDGPELLGIKLYSIRKLTSSLTRRAVAPRRGCFTPSEKSTYPIKLALTSSHKLEGESTKNVSVICVGKVSDRTWRASLELK